MTAQREFVGELGVVLKGPAKIECDCQAVVAIAGGESSFKRSLYLARRARFLQDVARRKVASVVKVDGEGNVADILTKILLKSRFLMLRHKLLGLGSKPKQSVSAVRMSGRIRFKR